jgi:DNA polymerase-3 subunit epsilon
VEKSGELSFDQEGLESVLFTTIATATTGPYPPKDRIIELALIRITPSGTVLKKYETLLNPHRDLGPIHKHGILAGQVRDAPTFEEIAGEVIDRLKGSVVVGHHVALHLKFLEAAFRRLDLRTPRIPSVCTMQLAFSCAAPHSRTLKGCCEQFDIAMDERRSAMDDAKATAQLFAACLKRGQERVASLLRKLSWTTPGVELWPSYPKTGKVLTRKAATRRDTSDLSYLERLVAHLPGSTGRTREVQSYLSFLDGVLEDRQITADEGAALLEVARTLKISRSEAVRAHHEYMRDLIRAALEDGVITEREREDLSAVRRLLRISQDEYDSLEEELKESG